MNTFIIKHPVSIIYITCHIMIILHSYVKTHKDKNFSSYTQKLQQCVTKHKSMTQVLILSNYKLF